MASLNSSNVGVLLNNPLVSVVVPMYNVEKYLPRCLDSLLGQSLDGIEIVCVDDGSPDESGKIAEKYALSHSNIKVVHRSNGGLGPARNTGIENSSGAFVGFVDSDDWVELDMYERLYQAAIESNADIVVGGHRDSSEQRVMCTKKHPLAGRTVLGRDQIDPIRIRLYGHAEDDNTTESFPMAVWASIYRREMIVKNHLRFKPLLSEDTLFNLRAYRCANVIAFTDITGYRYRKEGQASITKSLRSDLIIRYERFVEELLNTAEEEHVLDSVRMRIARTAIECVRLCAGIIAESNIPLRSKRQWLSNLVSSRLQVEYGSALSLASLPFQQRCFEKFLINGNYRCCIFLLYIRERVKAFRYLREG